MMINAIELFSGIGGMHYSIKKAGIPCNVVAAVDINTSANALYRQNFPHTRIYQRNIQSFTSEEINNLNCDLITMSPPCQPFTRVGLKKDESDKRTNALLHIIELLPKLNSTLRYVILENVQGFENSNSRNMFVRTLEECDFIYQEFLLNPLDYGVPCSRLRYYLIGKRRPLKFNFHHGDLMTRVPFEEERLNRILQEKNPFAVRCDSGTYGRPRPLSVILEDCVDLTRCHIPMKILNKYASVFDITFPFSNRCCCFTKAYGRYAEGTGSVLCPLPTKEKADLLLNKINHLERAYGENKDKINEELANFLTETRVRYFTPREIARLMCFPEEFSWPENCSTHQLYRLLGNSINVFMVTLLITLLMDGD